MKCKDCLKECTCNHGNAPCELHSDSVHGECKICGEITCDRVGESFLCIDCESSPDFFKRRGTFEISRKFIFEEPQAAMRILSNVLVVRAESMFIEDAVQYDAFSMMFEPIEDYVKSTHYQFIVEEDGKIKAAILVTEV